MSDLTIPSDLKNLYEQAREDAKKLMPRYPYAREVIALIERIAQNENNLRTMSGQILLQAEQIHAMELR